MRVIRLTQVNVFESYSTHEFGVQLKNLSDFLDGHPDILTLVSQDLVNKSLNPVGRKGLSVENVFRCLLLKQQLWISYVRLAFHLSDSMSCRSFARLPDGLMPKKSCLQSTIRRIKPETLEKVHELLIKDLFKTGDISLGKIRIDSTVVKSNIAPPADSALLNDAVRVLSRYLARSLSMTGKKIRFTDKRKTAKSLAFQIFNAKNALKEALYPELLKIVSVVLKQVERGLIQVKAEGSNLVSMQNWIEEVEHYRDLTLKIVKQTERRVIAKESVPSSEKIVSVFEPHTDVIVKGFRDVQYGHKVNLSSESRGLITYFKIEEGNPSDKDLFVPVLEAHEKHFGCLPKSTVCDGGYASLKNVVTGRKLGVKRAVFHKRVGISFQKMGVKIKTFKELRNFRAGVEGNISELKRAFGMGKATWKGLDGFKAFVWSSVITYNLIHLVRIQSG
jgi:IS5 family transposase